jgi:predicted amidohydrolase
MAFRIAVAQMNSQTGAVVANRDKALRLIEGAAALGAQIVLVPETFTTGYDIADRLDALAEPIPGTTTDILGEVAKSRRVYIYASMVEKAGGKYHNTGVLIDPSGKLVHAYRKVHLFATEKRMFTPGNEPAVVKTDLGTFGLTICMDLLFPEYIRGLVLSGAEIILNSTDWLRWGPLDEWQWCHEQPRALARTRALENTVGLAMACQWGEDGDYTKLGHSCIVSPSGRVLAGMEEGEGFAMHELGMEKVDDWRKIGTYLADRRDHLDLYRRMSDS